jgi:hypothetical protein
MSQLPAIMPPDLEADISALAQAYLRANGPVMALVNRIGGGVEAQMARLPQGVRQQIEATVIVALTAAHGLAGRAEEGPEIGPGAANWAAIATGAAGGLIGSIVELPLTITVFLHAIRAEAIRAGFDPDEAGVRAACLEVFAAGAPLQEDDGINSGFVSARLTLTGPALQKLIARVAPSLAVRLGQKLAAQSVPILGALSGAAVNAAFLRYYREVARIRFALMRLAEHSGGEAVVAAFARAVRAPQVSKA